MVKPNIKVINKFRQLLYNSKDFERKENGEVVIKTEKGDIIVDASMMKKYYANEFCFKFEKAKSSFDLDPFQVIVMEYMWSHDGILLDIFFESYCSMSEAKKEKFRETYKFIYNEEFTMFQANALMGQFLQNYSEYSLIKKRIKDKLEATKKHSETGSEDDLLKGGYIENDRGSFDMDGNRIDIEFKRDKEIEPWDLDKWDKNNEE